MLLSISTAFTSLRPLLRKAAGFRFVHSSKSANDYYGKRMVLAIDLLGVNKNSSPDEIKKAYFSMAKKFHPDVNKAPDANTRFTEINK